MNDNMKDYLCHMTDAEKKAYNAEYYRNHKNYWQDYYSKGQTVGRPTARQKYVTEGGNGVNRRGEGLGTGPIGNSGKNGKRTTLYENVLTENILTEQNPQQWAQQQAEQYVNDHKEDIAAMYISALSSGAKMAITIGKEVAKQAYQKAKKTYQSDFNSGMNTIVNKGKEFCKMWKLGLKRK